jgi:hypothetical protein
MFSAAWKMLVAATTVNCFHMARILPQDECESELESAHMVKKLATFIPKLGNEVELYYSVLSIYRPRNVCFSVLMSAILAPK